MVHGTLSDVKLVIVDADLNLRNMVMKILRDAGAQRMEAFGTVTQAVAYLRETEVGLNYLRNGTKPD